jgi:hypothetical protein
LWAGGSWKNKSREKVKGKSAVEVGSLTEGERSEGKGKSAFLVYGCKTL